MVEDDEVVVCVDVDVGFVLGVDEDDPPGLCPEPLGDVGDGASVVGDGDSVVDGTIVGFAVVCAAVISNN